MDIIICRGSGATNGEGQTRGLPGNLEKLMDEKSKEIKFAQ